MALPAMRKMIEEENAFRRFQKSANKEKHKLNTKYSYNEAKQLNDNKAVRILDYKYDSTMGTVLTVMQLGSEKTIQCSLLSLVPYHITNPSFITQAKAKAELDHYMDETMPSTYRLNNAEETIVGVDENGKMQVIRKYGGNPERLQSLDIDNILGVYYITNLSEYKDCFKSGVVREDKNFLDKQQFKIYTEQFDNMCCFEYRQDPNNDLKGTFFFRGDYTCLPGNDCNLLSDYCLKINIDITLSKDCSKIKIVDIKSWFSFSSENDDKILGDKKFTPFKERIGKVYSQSEFKSFMKDNFCSPFTPLCGSRRFNYSKFEDPRYKECIDLFKQYLEGKIHVTDDVTLKKYISAIEFIFGFKYVTENGNILKGEFQSHTDKPAKVAGIPVGFWEYTGVKVQFRPDFKEVIFRIPTEWLRTTEHMRLVGTDIKKVQVKQGYSEYSIPHDYFGIDNKEIEYCRGIQYTSDMLVRIFIQVLHLREDYYFDEDFINNIIQH